MRAVNKVLDIVRLGLVSLTIHKVRSALTALGIIIGVCGVMSSLAVNEGMIEQSQKAFRERGTDNIVINSKKPPDDDSARSRFSIYGLTKQDVTRLSDNVQGVIRAVKVHRTQHLIPARPKDIRATVFGTEPSFAQVARVNMRSGRFLRQTDMDEASPYVVITESLARKLFVAQDPLGGRFRIGDSGNPLTVVGILDRIPSTLSSPEGGGTEDVVVISLTSDARYFGEFNIIRSSGGETREKIEVSQLILQMADEQSVIEGAKVARSILTRTRDKADYEVTVPLEEINMMREQKKLMTLVSLGIAAISLVVGGIGIMNIMLASVTERTREIGIRRALGGKKKDIVTQFLVESVALTTAGGIVGIFVGLATAWSLKFVLAFEPIVTAPAVVFPFVMAIVVGLVSGLYPAMRAANLDPITALRHE